MTELAEYYRDRAAEYDAIYAKPAATARRGRLGAGDSGRAFIGFFWSHILRADLPRFCSGLRARLGSGARVIVLDNRYVPGSSTPISRTSDDGDTVQHRTLNDGRGFEIVKNFPAREQFATDVAGITATPEEWTELTYFWLATFQVHAPASSSASAT